MTETAATPWSVLRDVLDVPLHPGGAAATTDLLDRADVGPGTVLVDVGCGAGESVAIARDRGATAVGVDVAPDGRGAVRGDMNGLPVATGMADVVLAECTLCLAANVEDALRETRRVCAPNGRLAFSEMTVSGDLGAVPARLERALCLQGRRDEQWLVDRIEAAGFTVRDRRSHRDDLLAMRDELADAVDYRGLLRALGAGGRSIADGLERLEAAVERGTVGYVSLLADASA